MHLLEFPDTKSPIPQMLVRMWNNESFHSLLVGMQNGTAILEDMLADYFFFFYKTKHTFTM